MATQTITTIIKVAVDQIHSSPWQTRQTIDPLGIESLADSIERDGLLQPILVREIRRAHYELIAGQRRLMAWKLLIERSVLAPTAGIPAIVRQSSDRQMLLDTLTENLAREDVDLIEETRAMAQALHEIEDLTQADLAVTLKTSQAQVSNRIRLLRLPNSVLQLVSEGRMAWTTARELLCLVGDDHIHEEEIEIVLKHAVWNEDMVVTGPRVRREIIEACMRKPDRWRMFSGVDSYSVATEPPLFDMEQFKEMHESSLHRIPSPDGGPGQILVTCAGKEWRASQKQAKEKQSIEDPEDTATHEKWINIMAVPKRRELRRPILEFVVGEEQAVSPRQIRDSLLDSLSLTEDVLQEKIPSGQPRFVNEANRAISTLKIAGLLFQPSSGLYQATDLGRSFIATHEGDIWNRHLTEAKRQSPIFDHEHDDLLTNSESEIKTQETSVVSPRYVSTSEQLKHLNRKMNDELAEELLEGVRDISSDSFERLVVRLLERMGYGEGKVVGGSGDEGIDGIINQDPLGLEKVYIQAKRWQNQVGEPDIRNFSGSLDARGANKGVFITTSTFSSTASQTARNISAGNKFIRLINGDELARLMINHGVGVITETTYEVKQLDENYFVDL